MSDDLANIGRRVAGLDHNTSFADVVNAIGLIEDMERRLDAIKAEAKAVAGEIIRRDGEQRMGEDLWVLSRTKKEKSRDLLATVETVFQASGGEWGKFVDCLSTNAFKPGSVKKLLADAGTPEKFEAIYEVTYDDKVTVKRINTAFVKVGQ